MVGVDDKPEPFHMPGYGLKCASCGTALPTVSRTTTTDGFITRERRCPNPQCGEINITTERIIAVREPRGYNRRLLG